MIRRSEPDYVLFKNDCSDEEYDHVKNLLDGTEHKEVYSEDIFNNPVIPGKPVVGVNTSIGYLPRTGVNSIEETLEVLEEDNRRSSAEV